MSLLDTLEDSVMYTGDLEPAFEGTLSGRDDTDSTAVPNRLIGTRGGAIIFDEIITDKTTRTVTENGVSRVVTDVKFAWLVPFTEPGPIKFEVEVEWPGNRPQTFPACNKFIVKRDADLP